MQIEDAEALGWQRAKPSEIKARYSWLTCKNCAYHHYNSRQYCSTVTAFNLNIPLPSDQHHISGVAKCR